MNWNSLYKGILSIFILVPLIYAQNEDTFVLNGTEDASVLKDIKDLKSLEINTRELTQEDVNILCDLNSLETLTLIKININEETVNLDCLKDLQIKNLNLDDSRNKNLLENFPNLESLYIVPVNYFYQEELENIVAMKNLNELTLNGIYNVKNIDFETITGSSNVRILSIHSINIISLTPNFFKIFSQVEQINYNDIGHVFNQQEADGFKTLKNLKDFSFHSVSRCNEQEPLDFGFFINSIIINNAAPSSYYEYFKNNCLIDQTGITVTQEDVNKLCNIIDIQDLTLNYSFEEDINLECFKDLDIKKLNVTTEERPKNLLKNFPKLETLTLNSVNILNQEELETIVAMKNLRNLTLDGITESKVDFEAIKDTTNIRRLELHGARTGLDMPLTPNFFKIFSQIEQLDLLLHDFDQDEIDGLKTLKNLKEIMLDHVSCKEELDFGPLQNILKFTFYSMGYYGYEMHFLANCVRRGGITEDGSYYYIYNANRNQCIHVDGGKGAVTLGDCNDKPENVLWTGGTRIRYAANSNCCFNGNSLSCGDYCVFGSPPPSRAFEYYITNKHINPAPSGSTHRSEFGPSNRCLGLKGENSNELEWKECDDYDPDQFWEFISYNSTTGFIPPQIEEESSVEEYVYIYNADRNECLTTSGVFGTPITYGKCDNSDNTIWITSNSNGHIRSKANPIYCVRPNNVNSEGGVILGKCSPISHENQFDRSGNLIKHHTVTGYTHACIGSSEEDPSKTALRYCDEKDPNQIWYFNKWDPSVVVKETAIVYFYNAYKNECIHTDGSSVTMGSCDFNDDSLWEIPNSHKGYYRSKANPEKCLSVVDDKVSLTECNEDTKLYLDGNFIRSQSSKDHCIASSKSDQLEYVEGCDISNTDHIWYANIWESPETE